MKQSRVLLQNVVSSDWNLQQIQSCVNTPSKCKSPCSLSFAAEEQTDQWAASKFFAARKKNGCHNNTANTKVSYKKWLKSLV